MNNSVNNNLSRGGSAEQEPIPLDDKTGQPIPRGELPVGDENIPPPHEIKDPPLIDVVGNFENNEQPSNVDGAQHQEDPDDDAALNDEAGDDEDSPQPLASPRR